MSDDLMRYCPFIIFAGISPSLIYFNKVGVVMDRKLQVSLTFRYLNSFGLFSSIFFTASSTAFSTIVPSSMSVI